MKKFFLLILVIFAVQQNSFGQIDDDKNPILTEKFFIYAGVFSPLEQVDFAFNGSLPADDDFIIDLDETLKIKGLKNTFSTNFNWRFSKKWSLNSEYFSVRTKNIIVLEKDIVWNGYTLKKGTTIDGGYGVGVFKLGVGRVISKGKKHEFGALLGVYLLGVNGFISGTAFLDDDQVELDKSKISVTLPLPAIGLSYIYAPTTKLSFYAKGEWFGIKVDNLNGAIWNLSPGVRYQFFKHIGANLSYNYLSLNGNVDQENWKGSFQLQFQGPSLGLIAAF